MLLPIQNRCKFMKSCDNISYGHYLYVLETVTLLAGIQPHFLAKTKD
jgi:hypothetical protein